MTVFDAEIALAAGGNSSEFIFARDRARRGDLRCENLIANAGLALVGVLVLRLGLERLINDTVRLTGRVGGALPGRKLLTLVHTLMVGGSHIAHGDMLRAGIEVVSVDPHGGYRLGDAAPRPRTSRASPLAGATVVVDPFDIVRVRHEATWLRERVRDPPLRAVAAAR